MLEAELKWLRSCLAVPNGASAEVARDLYAGSQPWLSEYERQKSEGLDPLVNLDGSCYGAEISKEVVRDSGLCSWNHEVQPAFGTVLLGQKSLMSCH